MPSEIRTVLRRLYGRAGPPPRPEHENELEAELMQRFDRRAPAEATPWWAFRLPRWAWAGAAALAIAVGACVTPSDYEIKMGDRLGILIDAEERDTVDVREIVQFVRSGYPLERLEAEVKMERSVFRTGEGATEDQAIMRIQLDMVGRGVDADVVWEDLVAEFPALEGARMEDEELEGTVHGTFGGHLAHRYLDLVIDEHGVEEAKRRILADLEARGFKGEAEIDIQDHGDGSNHERKVEIRLREEEPQPPQAAPANEPR
jgi:hypothetical protein